MARSLKNSTTLCIMLLTLGLISALTPLTLQFVLGADAISFQVILLYFIFTSICVINSYFLYSNSSSARFIYPSTFLALAIALVVTNTSSVYLIPLTVSLAFAGISGLTLIEFDGLFTAPQAKLERASERFRKELPVQISYGHRSYVSKSFDVSTSGIFVEINGDDLDLFIESKEEMDFTITDGKEVCNVKAVPVRVESEAKGNYPVGIGFKFAQEVPAFAT